MTGISSLGVGSGLDLAGLVDTLLAAERAPTENSLDRSEADITAELSGVGLMKSALSEFQSSLSGLDDASNYNTRSASNTNTSALGLSVSNDAQVGSYSLDINNLAASQSLASTAYPSDVDTVGTGTIQISFGTITGPGFGSFTANPDKTPQTITVDSSNNTLQGLKEYINNGDYGVTASIINDGSGYRLTFTSNDTGAANAMEITITDTGDGNDTDSNGLSALAYNAAATNLTETQAASDASLSVNGLAITSATNDLDEVIEGVTLSLKETTTSSITVSVNEDYGDLSNSIRDLVEAYNALIGELNDLSFAPADGATGGLLVGDASLRNFTSSLQRIVTSSVDGLSGSITALSNLGITTQLDGTLAIDETRFSEAIDEDPDGALALFAPVGQTSDPLIKLNSIGSNTKPGDLAIDITSFETSGYMTGTGDVTNLQITNNRNELTVVVDGVSSGNITLTNGLYPDEDALAAEIQTQINASSSLVSNGLSVTVSYDSATDRFTITSDSVGSGSSVEITAVDPQMPNRFGLDVGTGVDGTDLTGIIGGELATGSGQTLTTASGISVDVLGGSLGPRGSLSYTRGFVEDLNELLDSYLDGTEGTLTSREKSLNESLEDIDDQRIELDLRMESVEASLVAQFSALDLLLAEYQATSDFISQQIENLPGSGSLLNNS